MDLGLAGKKALVTGGSRGIGRGIADALLREGAAVLVCARDVSVVGAETGLRATRCDLSQPGAASALVPAARESLGGLDILVMNSGGPPSGEVDDTPRTEWERWFQTLWMSTVDLLQAAMPVMTEARWGRILVVASVAGREPMANMVLSNSLRAGLLGLVKSTSRQVADRGVTVNAILPGMTDTRRRDPGVAIDGDALLRSVPAGRRGTTAEVGALAAFLASTSAGYITGQAIACDGGLLRSI